GRNVRLDGHGLWRAPALVPPLHEGLQGALRLGCQRERTSRQGALEQFHERGGRNRKHATAPDRKNQFCLQERWVDQRKSNHVSRWNATLARSTKLKTDATSRTGKRLHGFD